MTYCGIEYSLKNRPALDGDFLPFAPWRQAYLAQAAHPIRIAVERQDRSEEHTSELQSHHCISYAVFCLKK